MTFIQYFKPTLIPQISECSDAILDIKLIIVVMFSCYSEQCVVKVVRMSIEGSIISQLVYNCFILQCIFCL